LTTVAIIGAGPLGRWLALSAARAGFRVLLEDVMPLNLRHAQEFLRQQLGPGAPRMREMEESADSVGISRKATAGFSTPVAAATFAQDDRIYLGPAQDDSFLGVAFVSTIEDAVREADLVIDCVPDELESKLEILWLLDRMAPPCTVLATPTMRLSIADLANCTYRPEKVIAIAAEASSLSASAGSEILLRTTPHTAPETVALLSMFWERLGFAPRFELSQAE
jgi:3-hydroxybutyryl-CoA dehydrogenase